VPSAACSNCSSNRGWNKATRRKRKSLNTLYREVVSIARLAPAFEVSPLFPWLLILCRSCLSLYDKLPVFAGVMSHLHESTSSNSCVEFALCVERVSEQKRGNICVESESAWTPKDAPGSLLVSSNVPRRDRRRAGRPARPRAARPRFCRRVDPRAPCCRRALARASGRRRRGFGVTRSCHSAAHHSRGRRGSGRPHTRCCSALPKSSVLECPAIAAAGAR
jgi:hypothetical protein